MSILGKVDYNRLTATEKSVYSYLSEHIDEIPEIRIRQLSKQAYAGTATIMRLVHKLGYNSFTDFKNFVRINLRKSQAPSDFFSALSPNIYHKNLPSKLNELADMILNANSVLFFGLDASGSVCNLACRLLANMGLPGVYSLNDSTWPIVKQVGATADSLIVVLSSSGNTNEIVEILSEIRQNKDTQIAVITANPRSQAANLADLIISYEIQEWRLNLHDNMTSQIPAMFIMEQLAHRLYDKLNDNRKSQ